MTTATTSAQKNPRDQLSDRAIVSRYLEHLNDKRTHRRGPRLAQSVEELEARIEEIDAEMSKASVLARLKLTQERLELQAAIHGVAKPMVNNEELEEAFVDAAARYGAERGISYSAWREVGVPVRLLRRAGIHPRAPQTSSNIRT